MSEVSETVEITNKRGLHARASAKFVTLASAACPNRAVEVEKDGSRVSGTSIMGLMMLGAAMGDSITITPAATAPSRACDNSSGWSRHSFGED